MQLTLKQLGGIHQVLVIGDQEDSLDMRARGILVLGSVDGPVNASMTLDRRVRDLVDKVTMKYPTPRIFAWGWHGATVASGLGNDYEPVAFVDDIDRSCSILGGNITIIPTSQSGSRILSALGVPIGSIAEPLIGVIPSSILVDRESVRELLHLEQAKNVVALVGKRCSWQEVIRMVVRLCTSRQRVDFIMPERYIYHAQLISAAKKQGVTDMLHVTPSQLRHVDVINGVDGVWAPLVAPHDESCEVLDVIETVWAGVPIVVSASHPVAGVPHVGQEIVSTKNEIEICGWLLSLAEDPISAKEKADDLTAHVKSIASPSSFIEGLQQRMSSSFRLRRYVS